MKKLFVCILMIQLMVALTGCCPCSKEHKEQNQQQQN